MLGKSVERKMITFGAFEFEAVTIGGKIKLVLPKTNCFLKSYENGYMCVANVCNGHERAAVFASEREAELEIACASQRKRIKELEILLVAATNARAAVCQKQRPKAKPMKTKLKATRKRQPATTTQRLKARTQRWCYEGAD